MADRMAGRVLNGRYELSSVLGGGGMALVYRGLDRVLNRTVAVKVLREQYAGDPTFQQRFTREAQAAAGLTHPNIVSVYDVGKDAEAPYIVMEYVPGLTLRDLIAGEGVLPVGRAVDIAAGILAALEYAHRNGLIHRDIKPGNVLITPQGTVKVVDFGIAKGASDLSLTGAGIALGTAAYFAPEQARGEPARVQSDLYALGITLYEMLTGRTPFQSDSDVGMAYKHINEPPLPPRRLNPAIPPQLEAIILRALAKNPAARFGSAAEMESHLRNYAAFGAGATAAVPQTPRLAPPPRQNTPPAATYAPVPRQAAPAWPQPVVVPTRGGFAGSACLTWLLGAAALMLLLVGAAFALNGPLGPGATPTAGLGGLGTPVNLPTPRPPGLPSATRPPAAPSPTAPAATRPPEETATVPPSATALPTQPPLPSPTAIVVALMPNLVGSNLEDVQGAISELSLQLVVSEQRNDPAAAGVILSQDPAPNTRISPGATVRVVISKGPQLFALPSVVNTSGAEAQTFLANPPLGLKVTLVEEVSTTVPAGVVIRQEPGAGSQVKAGDMVTLVVSKGDQVVVPDVVGTRESEAVEALEAVGLRPEVTRVQRDQVPGIPKAIKDGQVITTDPDAGVEVERGSTVAVLVLADKE